MNAITIKTVFDFNRCMQEVGAHIDGGYPTYFVTTDGCALSFETAQEEGSLIRDALISDERYSGWRVCAMTVNWEDASLFCEHSGLRIQSAYAEDEANEAAEFSPEDLDVFRDAYEECALWSSVDEEGESLEQYDTSIDCHNAMMRDCRDFMDANAADLRDAMRTAGYTIASAGHDFWLTRNGHGAGFWGRGLGKVGERLTAAAKVYGGVDLYVSDNGEVYA